VCVFLRGGGGGFHFEHERRGGRLRLGFLFHAFKRENEWVGNKETFTFWTAHYYSENFVVDDQQADEAEWEERQWGCIRYANR
jgi:hypothetical protein